MKMSSAFFMCYFYFWITAGGEVLGICVIRSGVVLKFKPPVISATYLT
jgi:hypothetical protein